MSTNEYYGNRKKKTFYYFKPSHQSLNVNKTFCLFLLNEFGIFTYIWTLFSAYSISNVIEILQNKCNTQHRQIESRMLSFQHISHFFLFYFLLCHCFEIDTTFSYRKKIHIKKEEQQQGAACSYKLWCIIKRQKG